MLIKIWHCFVRHKDTLPLYSGSTKFYNTHFFLEPEGLRTPRLNSDVKSITLERSAGFALALLCEAQGYPMPLFRYVLYFFS